MDFLSLLVVGAKDHGLPQAPLPILAPFGYACFSVLFCFFLPGLLASSWALRQQLRACIVNSSSRVALPAPNCPSTPGLAVPATTSLLCAPRVCVAFSVPLWSCKVGRCKGRVMCIHCFPTAGLLTACWGYELEFCLQTVKQQPLRCFPAQPTPLLTP